MVYAIQAMVFVKPFGLYHLKIAFQESKGSPEACDVNRMVM